MKILNEFYTYDNRCLVVQMEAGHLCGYVAIERDHPLYGKEMDEEVSDLIPFIATKETENIEDEREYIGALLKAQELSPTIENMFRDIHNGITYCDYDHVSPQYMHSISSWLIGFHCADPSDTPEICNEEFVAAECAKLSRQLHIIKNKDIMH